MSTENVPYEASDVIDIQIPAIGPDAATLQLIDEWLMKRARTPNCIRMQGQMPAVVNFSRYNR